MLKYFAISLFLSHTLVAQVGTGTSPEVTENAAAGLSDSHSTESPTVSSISPEATQTVPQPEFVADNFKISGEKINYTLAPGDVITLRVFQEPDMTTQQRISQDGTVFLPLIGKIQLSEMSIGEASRKITELLRKDFFVNPQVALSIDRYAPRRFTILGQAGRPGTYQIPPEEVISLPMAIAVAGGNTRLGDVKKITVSRKEKEETKMFQIDLRSPESRDFIIQPGDIITIPERMF